MKQPWVLHAFVKIKGLDFPGGASVRETSCQSRRHKTGDLIPGSERLLGGGNGNPLQFSGLESPMHRGGWQATVHRVAELDMTEAI